MAVPGTAKKTNRPLAQLFSSRFQLVWKSAPKSYLLFILFAFFFPSPMCTHPPWHFGGRRTQIMASLQFGADKALQGILVPCQFACHGCKLRQQIHVMEHHEVHCQYREVYCPANQRGVCHWFGSLLKIVGHVKERRCIQVN